MRREWPGFARACSASNGANTSRRLSLERSRPFGDDAWTMKLASQLGLEHTIRREGRPKLEKTDVEPKY